MKITCLLAIVLFACLFLGCSQSDKQVEAAKEDTPAPLKDESEGGIIRKMDSKRFDNNEMVDALYDDIIKKDSALHQLEDQIQWFDKARLDSLSAYNNYYNKSESYYSSANTRLENIKDTVLKERLKVLIAGSEDRLEKKVSVFSNLINGIDKESSTISDYHNTLKLVATLSVIEQYQNKNLPPIKSVKSLF
jgi:hypothetical protein